MALVTSVISSQTERIRRRGREDGHPVRHESRAYVASSVADVAAKVARRHVSEVFAGAAWVLIPGRPPGILALRGLR